MVGSHALGPGRGADGSRAGPGCGPPRGPRGGGGGDGGVNGGDGRRAGGRRGGGGLRLRPDGACIESSRPACLMPRPGDAAPYAVNALWAPMAYQADMLQVKLGSCWWKVASGKLQAR